MAISSSSSLHALDDTCDKCSSLSLSLSLSLSPSLLCTTVCQSNNHVAPRKFRIACIQLGHIAPRHRSVRRHVHKLEMPKRAPSLIFLTGFHSESENLGVLSDSSHEPIIRHCWHCCILRYERTRQGAGLAYDAVADGWARRQKASLGPPSLSLSLSSLLSQCGGRSGQVSRSIALSRLARSPAVSFPATIFCQSDLKTVSTLSL